MNESYEFSHTLTPVEEEAFKLMLFELLSRYKNDVEREREATTDCMKEKYNLEQKVKELTKELNARKEVYEEKLAELWNQNQQLTKENKELKSNGKKKKSTNSSGEDNRSNNLRDKEEANKPKEVINPKLIPKALVFSSTTDSSIKRDSFPSSSGNTQITTTDSRNVRRSSSKGDSNFCLDILEKFEKKYHEDIKQILIKHANLIDSVISNEEESFDELNEIYSEILDYKNREIMYYKSILMKVSDVKF